MRKILLTNFTIDHCVDVPGKYSLERTAVKLGQELGYLSLKQMFQYSGVEFTGDITKIEEELSKLSEHKWSFVVVYNDADYENINILVKFILCGIEIMTTDNLVKHIDSYYRLPRDGKKLQKYIYSLQRFTKSLASSDVGDMVLDVAASLESIFELSDELRLRLSLIALQITKSKKVMKDIYDLYGLRNNYIHGNTAPDISKERKNEILKSAFEILVRPLTDGKLYNLGQISKDILNF